MGALTKKEREGLDEVFLSIHSSKTHYGKNFLKLFNRAKLGLKETKLSYFFRQYRKKKKNLSK